MMNLIVACGFGPGFERLLMAAFAGFATICLLFGLATATVTAKCVGQRWPLWLTPVFALLWGTLPVATLLIGHDF